MRQRQERRAAAFELLADLLIDAAALRLSSPNDADALAAAAERLRALARQREQACVTALLALYNFRPSDIDADALPLQGERWGMDLFHPQALKDMGIQLGMGAAAGAMAGAAVDLFSAGLSLGTGMLIERGRGWAVAGRGKARQARGGQAARLARDQRGRRRAAPPGAAPARADRRARTSRHAARTPIRIVPHDGEDLRKGALPAALKEARSRPEWSALGQAHEDSERRSCASWRAHAVRGRARDLLTAAARLALRHHSCALASTYYPQSKPIDA